MKYMKLYISIILLYLYIYNPVFRILGFSLLKVYVVIAFAYIVLFNKIEFYINKCKIEFVFFALSILFTIIQVYILGDRSAALLFYHQSLWFFESFIASILVVEYIYHNKYNFFDLLIITGTIAAIVSCFLLLNREIAVFLRLNIITDSLFDLYPDKKQYYLFRSFGLAEGLTASYGIIQGVIAVLCFFKTREKSRYIIPIPFIIISILVNTRTGILPVLFFLPVLLSSMLKNKKVMLGFLIILIFVFLFLKGDLSDYKETLDWITTFFESIMNLLYGEKTDAFDTLTGSDLFFPDSTTGFLFGEGRSVFWGRQGSEASDIGFVNQLFKGGLLYVLLIMAYLLYFCIRLKKMLKNIGISILFFVTLMLANYKGVEVILPNGIFRLMSFCYVYSLYSNYKKRTMLTG